MVKSLLKVVDDGPLPSLGKLKAKINIASISMPYSNNCLLKAQNDLEAIDSWLEEFNNRLETYKSYARESDRLILWCTYKQGKTIAELTKEDFEDFIAFLQKPPKSWCMSRKGKKIIKGDEDWRPFYGPLSLSAMQKSIRIINSLLNYLVNADYIRANPLKLIKHTRRFSIDNEEQKYKVWERILEDNEWQAIQDTLQNMPEKSNQEINLKITSQFLFAMLYFLGVRINEAASQNWNAFREYNGSWWFFVKGKGGKLGHIPVNDELLSYIKIFRLHLNKLPLPAQDETSPIFYSSKTNRCVSTRWLYKLVKDIGNKASYLFPEESKSFYKLKKLSPHWLRHLSASHQDQLGTPMSVIQANHRHSSSQTTQIYVHAEDKIRAQHMQKMQMSVKPKLTSIESEQKYKVLSFSLSGGGLNLDDALKNFFQVLEQEILKEIKWTRSESLEKIIKSFKYNKRFGKDLIINYQFDVAIDSFILESIHAAIKREAEFRMFKLTITTSI